VTGEAREPGRVEVSRHGDVATILLDRPRVNALSSALLGELAAALDGLHREPPGAVVLTGGRRLFAAGAEISELADEHASLELADAFQRALSLLTSLPRVTVAAINGVALGGGLELALACDLRVAASDARLGCPEILLGVFPGAGATQRLSRLVGAGVAKDMIFTGRHVHAEEAKAIGLVDRLAEPDEVLAAAQSLGGELARGPLLALASAKRAIDEGLDRTLPEGLALERELFLEVLRTEDARRGFESFFASGPGHAAFTGR
jgi:enoyl-CoA hydratase